MLMVTESCSRIDWTSREAVLNPGKTTEALRGRKVRVLFFPVEMGVDEGALVAVGVVDTVGVVVVVDGISSFVSVSFNEVLL